MLDQLSATQSCMNSFGQWAWLLSSISTDTEHTCAQSRTATHMPKRKAKSGRKWSMYPDLHDDVSLLLEEDNLYFDFHEDDNSRDCTNEYDTNIMGKFTCPNRACSSRKWSSRRIAITVRMYPGARYNARVYNQRCQGCDSLGVPSLDGSYAERVAYRLKRWSGIEMERPAYSGQSKGPHQTERCEGCKEGHCTQS